MLEGLKAGLREAEVLELGPGAQLQQRSSLVVLKGTLRASGHADSMPASHSGAAPVPSLVRIVHFVRSKGCPASLQYSAILTCIIT